MFPRYNVVVLFLPSSLLSLIALLPMGTVPQSTSPSLTGEATISTSTPYSRNRSTRSVTTSFAPVTASNTTASPTTSTSTPNPNPVFPSISSHQDPTEGVFNYYFLFLAAFGVIVAICLWWIHRRRRKRKQQMQLSGQDALARDMEGWTNTRRWFHGSWRPNQTHALVRREEGLNEHGEAPPPYQPRSEAMGQEGETQDLASGLEIPPRTLHREDVDTVRPPEYRETNNGGVGPTGRPVTGNPHATTFGTADSPPMSSIRNLIRDQRS